MLWFFSLCSCIYGFFHDNRRVVLLFPFCSGIAGGTHLFLQKNLFCNENGDPLSRARIQREIDQITKRITAAGHEFPHITAHVFRHTFATRAIEAGMQPQVLKTILGHSSLAMTMDLYSHVLPDTKADEMEKIANVF